MTQITCDLENITYETLVEAIDELGNHDVYLEDLLEALKDNAQCQNYDRIGASMVMWLCRYSEIK